jgi:hypothetical protein
MHVNTTPWWMSYCLLKFGHAEACKTVWCSDMVMEVASEDMRRKIEVHRECGVEDGSKKQ